MMPLTSNYSRFMWLFTAASAVAMLAPGCAAKTIDLQAVQNFGKTTAAAADSFQEISADYYASCVRYNEYRQETRLGSRPLTSIPAHASIAPMPTIEPVAPAEPTDAPKAAPRTAPTPLPTLPTGANDIDCQASKALSDRWSLENRVLVGYVQALADIAGVATAPDKSSFEALGSALKGAGVIANDDTAKAGGDLAAAIAGSFIRRKQEHDIIGLVTDTKGSVDTLVAGLQQVALGYRLITRQELVQLETTRTSLLSAESERLGVLRQLAALPVDSPQADPSAPFKEDDSPKSMKDRAKSLHISETEERARFLAALRLRQRIGRDRAQFAVDIQDTVRRANMASDYYRAVTAIQHTHDALVKAHGGLDAVVVTVRPFVDELADPVNALIAASKKK